MKVFVTGGAGFIGGYLVRQLLHDGHRVRIFERPSLDKKNRLESLGKKSHLTLCWGDVATATPVIPKGTDWVFHLAGRGGAAASLADPLAYHRMHVDGTVHVLEAARRAEVKKFIYLGSTSWYTYPDHAVGETPSLHSTDPYALVKYLAEQYIRHWSTVYQVPFVILRPFSVYGPAWYRGGAYGSAITALLRQHDLGEPYSIIGNGRQRRDFVYITDVIHACLLAAQSGVTNEIFNVGTGVTHSMNDVVRLLDTGPIRYIPKTVDEPLHTQADITKITQLLGWEPTVGLVEGMRLVRQRHHQWQKLTQKK